MTEAHFESLAPSYPDLRGDAFADELTDRIAAEYALAGSRLLDVGCGPGHVVARLADRWDVDGVGVDRSAPMIDEALRRFGDRAAFSVADVEQLPFADGEFDAVLARMMIHLVDRAAACRELARVLRPGGRLVVTTADPDRIDAFWCVPFFPSFAAVDLARFPTAAALRQELLTAGFGGVEAQPLAIERRYSRAEALEKLRGRAYSTFALIDDDEFTAGLARAEAELPDPLVYDSCVLNVSAVIPPRASRAR
jgi:ubiquinone/menaquinone biosynthesis C-methylase UbiE